MPNSSARLATREPMAPRPMTPRLLPQSSGPEKALLPFSTRAGTSSPLSAIVLTQSIAPSMSREASSMSKIIISFVASAFAPGALNTTMPRSAQSSMGMLFTPAPARPMQSSSGQNSVWCRSALRMSRASGFSTWEPTSQPWFSRI